MYINLISETLHWSTTNISSMNL